MLGILETLDLMPRTMVLTDAATALRISEVLALKWYDLDFTDQLIRVRRAYVERRFGPPKSPPAANMLVADYLRVAASQDVTTLKRVGRA